ncbi:hypothetical protein C8R43DRAFT_1239682 [Mycena crocata]|nr:hypothetical protein C8R43DRAFT_1239682 [Mycena crocata]
MQTTSQSDHTRPRCSSHMFFVPDKALLSYLLAPLSFLRLPVARLLSLCTAMPALTDFHVCQSVCGGWQGMLPSRSPYSTIISANLMANSSLRCIHPIPEEDTIILIFARLSTLLYTGPGTAHNAAFVETTSGLTVLLTRTWAVALFRGELHNLPGISYLIGEENLQHNIGEYIEGAGGSSTQLCRLVIKHIDFLVTHKFSDVILFHLHAIILFVCRLCDKDQLFAALLDVGLARSLTAVAVLLATPHVEFDAEFEVEQGLTYCFHFMTTAMAQARSGDYSLDMLKGGILPLIVTLGQSNRFPSKVNAFLHQILPNAMVHYAFVTEFKVRLATLPELPDASGSCGRIAPKFRFRRCGACAKRKYCSRECQSVDWHDADHRSVCTLQLLSPDPATSRERGFFRTILHRQYQKIKFHILRAQLEFLVTHPGADFYMVFLHERTPPLFQILSIEGPQVPGQPPRPTDAAWVDAVARARRSKGQMEVHLLKIAEGEGQRERIVTLRSDSTAIYDGLRILAAGIPPGADLAALAGEIAEDITQLMQDTQDVVQVHCH